MGKAAVAPSTSTAYTQPQILPSKEPNWPPKSPHEALLSSPSGRRKLQSRRDRDSPSLSPIRRLSSVKRPGSRARISSSDEDEDEETLELQLKAIEARLKLKKLQQAKAKQLADQDSDNGSARISSRASTAASLRKVDLPRSQSGVQVPVSPVHAKRAPEAPKSPARVILGIDKGLRAQDVSLKRAPRFHARSQNESGTLSASRSQQGSGTGQVTETGTSAPRGKTFSERIAESRLSDRERQEKESRIQKARSRGFGFVARALESSQDGASSRAASSLSSGSSLMGSLETTVMLPPTKKATLQPLQKSRSLANLETTHTPRSPSTLSARSETSHATAKSSLSRFSTSTLRNHNSAASTEPTGTPSNNNEAPLEATTIFETFSGFHLSKRLIPHNTLTRTLDSKDIFTIPKLLKTVRSPNYDAPDFENDYVVLGIIASKSSPLTPKNVRRTNSTGDPDDDTKGPDKFMVLKLTDLKWEVNLYLFDTGFSAFWKLSVGTIIAVLNPDILPPHNRDSGQFSLKLTSSEDTVLEIGGARDLGFCKAVKRDGKECGQWIDSRKTEYCDFHVSLQVEKSKRGRMEVNTMTGFGKDPAGRGRGGSYGMFGGRGGGSGGGNSKNDGMLGAGRYHDKYLHETVYIAPGTRSIAQLLDNDDAYERGFSRAELHRRRLAEKEKERELARKLGEMGEGMGSEYMRLKGSDTPNIPAGGEASGGEVLSMDKEKKSGIDGTALGLLGRKAGDVSLSPIKRKRGGGKVTASEPVGWSGAFKKGLLSPKKQEQRETSPTKKRARFMLAEKGIREPGRDSLGGLDVGLLAAMDEDDDDGLDII